MYKHLINSLHLKKKYIYNKNVIKVWYFKDSGNAAYVVCTVIGNLYCKINLQYK